MCRRITPRQLFYARLYMVMRASVLEKSFTCSDANDPLASCEPAQWSVSFGRNEQLHTPEVKEEPIGGWVIKVYFCCMYDDWQVFASFDWMKDVVQFQPLKRFSEHMSEVRVSPGLFLFLVVLQAGSCWWLWFEAFGGLLVGDLVSHHGECLLRGILLRLSKGLS